MRCRASAVSSGKPSTTPDETMIRDTSCARRGRFWRKPTSSAMASSPAIEARRKVNNNGSISCTASRVAGSEPLKMITPSKP